MKNIKFTNEFISQVLSEVKFKEAHAEIQKELISHIDSTIENQRESGITREEIEKDALERLGDPKAIGIRLNEVHKPRFEYQLICLTMCLLAIGLFAMFKVDRLSQQGLWFVLGLIPCFGLAIVRPDTIRKSSVGLYLGTLILGALVFFLGVQFDGQPYLSIGKIYIKFVDLSVVLFVVSISGTVVDTVRKSIKAKAVCLAAIAIPFVTYLSIGSIYPAASFFCACLVMMIVSAWSTATVVGTVGVGAALLTVFVKPQHFVSADAFLRIVDSEKHTDFVFNFLQSTSSLLATTTAVLSTCFVVYLVLLCKGIKSTYGKTVTAGATCLLSVGVIFGLVSNLGFAPMPITGVNFPFLSYGGSLLLGHLALIGIILGQQRRKNIQIYA